MRRREDNGDIGVGNVGDDDRWAVARTGRQLTSHHVSKLVRLYGQLSFPQRRRRGQGRGVGKYFSCN